MDWDAHLQPPEHFERSIEFDFYTFFDDIEVSYHWEDGILYDDEGEEVDLDSFNNGKEIKAYIEQTLWEYGLPDEPREEIVDDKYVASFFWKNNEGTVVWSFNSVRTIPEDGDWGDTVEPTADIIKKAYDQLGNPFIAYYPQWRKFDRFEA